MQLKARRRLLGAGLAALAALALALLLSHGSLTALFRHAAARVLGTVRLVERRLSRKEEASFDHLATSQVGYGPGMQKQFTSPRPFSTFRLEEVATGAVAFAGRGPTRSVETDVLGAMHTVFLGDFSTLSAPGRYRVVADNGLQSFPFDIGPAVFDAPLRAVQRWFYYQRAFSPVQAPYAEGPWTHPSDADKAPPGVHGGWHDAGDFSIYSAYLNPALFWLLEAYSDFAPKSDDSHIPESGNGIPDLLDEARLGLEWLLSVQDATGGFANTTCQETYGPYGTNTPNSVPRYRNGEVGTLATGRAVGNLAFASVVYRPVDTAFAERCLHAARAGMRYLDAHRGEATDGPTCPAARRDGDVEVARRAANFAAAGMLLATGEAQFREAFEATLREPQYDPAFLHLDGQAALLYLRAPAGDEARKRSLRARLRQNADRALAEGLKHPFQWASRYHWGSLGAGFLRAGLSSVPLCLENPTLASADCEQAMASVHYALGRNGKQLCYLTGLSGVSRGMQWGFHQWLETLDAHPRDFPGMVAGGPSQSPEANDVSTPQGRPVPLWGYFGDPAFPRDATTPIDGRYTDNDSWSTNETSVEWEGEAVYLLSFAQWLAHGAPARSAH